jgi:hypothetical protein
MVPAVGDLGGYRGDHMAKKKSDPKDQPKPRKTRDY